MTRKEAIAIIRKEYLCVDRDCDIDRSCGKCDLMIPSKEPILEAYKMALSALEQQPCEDTISRAEALKSAICIFESDSVMKAFCMMKMLEEIPPVTPKPKTGKWIVDGSVDCYLDKVRCHCSKCGKKKVFPADYDHIKQKLSICYKHPESIDNYCPNCGAKMVEPQESEK